MKRRTFLRNASVAAITVQVPLWAQACGGGTKPTADQRAANPPQNKDDAKRAEWESLAGHLEEQVFTAGDPGQWEGKGASHIPVVEFAEGQATVKTLHGMAADHFISTQYVRDQNGDIIAFAQHSGTDAEASLSFELPEGTTEITAFSHCNLHGHWKTDANSAG